MAHNSQRMIRILLTVASLTKKISFFVVCRDHTGIKTQLLMLYYAKLNGQIKIQVCGLVYAKT